MFATAFSEYFNNNFIAFRDSARDFYNKIRAALADMQKLILNLNEFNSNLSRDNFMCVAELVESCIFPKIYEKLYSCLENF